MRSRRVTGLAVAALPLLLVLTACGGGGHGGGSAAASTPATSAAPTTSTTLTPIDQVPAVITVEYVQRVMDALDKVEGNLTRKLYADKLPSPEWRNGLMAIFVAKGFDDAEAAFGRDAANAFENYRNPPGDPISKVHRVDDFSNTCIVAEARRDLSAFFTRAPSEDSLEGVLILQAKDPSKDPAGVNPTAWTIYGSGLAKPGADLEHACH